MEKRAGQRRFLQRHSTTNSYGHARIAPLVDWQRALSASPYFVVGSIGVIVFWRLVPETAGISLSEAASLEGDLKTMVSNTRRVSN